MTEFAARIENVTREGAVREYIVWVAVGDSTVACAVRADSADLDFDYDSGFWDPNTGVKVDGTLTGDDYIAALLSACEAVRVAERLIESAISKTIKAILA